MTIKPVGAFSAILVGASLLAACGGGTAAPSLSTAASSAAPVSSAASPAISAAPAASSAAPAAASAPASASSAASAPAATSAAAKPAASAPALLAATTTIGLAVKTDAKLGSILTDAAGKTVYIFTKDAPGASNCTAGCLAAWPPVLSAAAPTAPAGFSGKFDILTRTDSPVKQVTVNQMPIYYFAADSAPGDTKGEGVGNSWHVVKAS